MSKYNTEQRKKLISYFENNSHRSVSAQDIYATLQSQDISMSAIYRNLAEMEKENLICKVNENNRSSICYQYIDPVKCINAIHLKCQHCDSTIHLNHHISELVSGYAKEEYGFALNFVGAFLYGKCATCSQKLVH